MSRQTKSRAAQFAMSSFPQDGTKRATAIMRHSASETTLPA
ncbi:hypothetical protein ABUE34_08050 [Kozakia baliensis]